MPEQATPRRSPPGGHDLSLIVLYDDRVAKRLRRVLSARADVVEKRMVGGLSFMVDGRLCCGVTGDALMVRVGSDAYDRLLAEPHVRPMAFAGRSLVGYVCVEPAGYRTDAELATWVQRGIDFVLLSPARDRARRR